LLKIAIGTGVLAMPSGYKKIHIFGGIFISGMAMLLQFYSWCLLTKSMEEKSKII
jgi:amino acid permease